MRSNQITSFWRFKKYEVGIEYGKKSCWTLHSKVRHSERVDYRDSMDKLKYYKDLWGEDKNGNGVVYLVDENGETVWIFHISKYLRSRY